MDTVVVMMDKGDAGQVLLHDAAVGYGTLELMKKDSDAAMLKSGRQKEKTTDSKRSPDEAPPRCCCCCCCCRDTPKCDHYFSSTGCREWAACCCDVAHEISRVCHSCDCKGRLKKCCSAKKVKQKLPILQWLPKYR